MAASKSNKNADGAPRKRPARTVILDATVPGGMGSREVATALRKIDLAARVVPSTGQTSVQVAGDHRNHGFADTILKPYTAAELGKVVQKVCAEQGPASGGSS